MFQHVLLFFNCCCTGSETPTHVDKTLALLAGAKVFSKLDANSRFWQVSLAELCRHLTTFITPFRRYCFSKLLFGISIALEFFQNKLEGLPRVLCHLDDILYLVMVVKNTMLIYKQFWNASVLQVSLLTARNVSVVSY